MSQKDNVTIEDIARHANVSISTVSRVLRKSGGVSSTKRQAVLHAAEVLNYRPNVFAQSLASGQSMTIGVITQNFGSPFYDGILDGIMQGFEHSDYTPIFVDGRWEQPVEELALQTLLIRRVDGLIVIGGQLPEAVLREINTTTPVVCAARYLPSMPDQCFYVDNFQAAYQAVRYLLDMGHRTIAHITARMHYQDSISDAYQRYRGYRQALLDAGIQPDPQLLIEGDLRQQSGVIAVNMLLSQRRPFSAIFAANDQMAFGARLALYRHGIRVPDEVSLVGFDDETTAAYMVPPLTTVRQPAVDIGLAATAAVLRLINGKYSSSQKFGSELIVRESVQRRR